MEQTPQPNEATAARTTSLMCPIDQTVLAMSSREGVEIDYCPRCRGVWLDRGELDKIVEMSVRYAQGAPGIRENAAQPYGEPPQPQPYGQQPQPYGQPQQPYGQPPPYGQQGPYGGGMPEGGIGGILARLFR